MIVVSLPCLCGVDWGATFYGSITCLKTIAESRETIDVLQAHEKSAEFAWRSKQLLSVPRIRELMAIRAFETYNANLTSTKLLCGLHHKSLKDTEIIVWQICVPTSLRG